ncbi:MAG: tRNA 2-thiouridine(34) synthase MnmA [Firmicutes bacterium]|nr:tRNA 2-thiouridine(34) synthase MnmA [Bacillota bacterium]
MESRNNHLDKNKVVLGLSGGVDSTAAALLLQKKGYRVIGYFFDTEGNNLNGRREAERVAAELGIDFIYEDVSCCFQEMVVENFCSEYLCGRTPNPCIICNPNIKFQKLIEVADREGAYYIATGHYARVYHDSCRNLYFVQQGANTRKDQSYMLYRLGQNVLSRLVFPLGNMEDKEEIRQLARGSGLSNAEKKDSQEICFISDDDYASYIEGKGYIAPSGDFVDKEGNILGQHKGILHYTMGQRKGLGIALGKPVFVTKIDPEKNQVILGDNEELLSHVVLSTDHVITEAIMDMEGRRVQAKVRYSARPAAAVIHVERVAEDVAAYQIRTVFEEPQRAVTPGQSIVFYDGDVVVGGGFIQGSIR